MFLRFLADFVEVAKDMLSGDEVLMVQKEFDRIMLHAVHYIVGKQRSEFGNLYIL